MGDDDEDAREAEIREESARLLDAVNPAFGYAMRKLGYVISTMNACMFSHDEIEAWNAAVQEWYDLNP